MKKIKVSIDEIIKLSNYSHRDFGTFASFLKGLADSDGFIEVDSNNELLETHTVKEDGYKWDLPKLKELGMKVKKAMEEPTTPEKKIHTKPMKKCKICKMDYCPECFEFCHMCPRPSVSECHQGESEKRNDVY